MHTQQAQAFEELVKFMAIAADNDGKSEMWSEYIDEVWHREIRKDNGKYLETRAGIGKIQHVEDSGEGQVSWIDKYHERFGALDKTWFLDKSGNVRSDLFEHYKRTNTIIASWGCGPVLPDPNSKREIVKDRLPDLDGPIKVPGWPDQGGASGDPKTDNEKGAPSKKK
jgi:hypothetical protein